MARYLTREPIAVTPAQVMSAVIGGAGGAGGATATAGLEGGETTLDTYSSAAGERRGYTDILTGEVIGITGLAGRAGKDGVGKSNYGTPDEYYDGYTTHGLLATLGNWGGHGITIYYKRPKLKTMGVRCRRFWWRCMGWLRGVLDAATQEKAGDAN